VLIVISFVILTFSIQAASFKMFSKPKKMNYVTKDFKGDYEALPLLLKKANFKERKTEYGPSYLKVSGTTAYKCVIVKDVEAYFNPKEEDPNYQGNKDLDKCDKFIGVEIFSMISESDLPKLADFSMMGNRVYYTALLYQGDGLFKCLNYKEPTEAFSEGLKSILNDLQIEENIKNE